jgi:hypothetical protein
MGSAWHGLNLAKNGEKNLFQRATYHCRVAPDNLVAISGAFFEPEAAPLRSPQRLRPLPHRQWPSACVFFATEAIRATRTRYIRPPRGGYFPKSAIAALVENRYFAKH